MADVVALDNPALAPMSPNEPHLFGRGRCPGRGRIAERKTAHSDKIDSGLFWIEHRLSNINLDSLLVRVDTLKLSPKGRGFLLHSPEPNRVVACRFHHILKARSF